MSLFRRDSPPPTMDNENPTQRRFPLVPARGAGAAVVAPGLQIKGDLTGHCDLLVEGEVLGNVQLDAVVTVGAGGLVQGDVEAGSVRVTGKIVGNVKAKELVEIAPTGILEGNISAARVVIAEGAFLKGKVEMRARKLNGEGSGKAATA